MKKLILFAAAVAATACMPETSKVTVTVENTLRFDRATELVEIRTENLGGIVLAEGEAYEVKTPAGVIPSQVTHDGRLVFQSGLGAGEKAHFVITAGSPQKFVAKTRGRFAPERYDDFIWENDRVAFRIYGAALQPIDGPSNGIDALYKRTEGMIIDRWYADHFEKGLSYHDDNGTGLDDYKVGRTLGAGAAAPYIDGKLILNSNFTGQELLDNGPLRTTFRLTYPDLELPTGEKIAETRTFSIDAGSQMTRVVQKYGTGEPLNIVVGYPMHADEVKHISIGRVMMLAEPATPKASGVYLGAVLPSIISETLMYDDGQVIAPHILAVKTYTPNEPFVYYTGFGWERFGDWTAAKFSEYLGNFAAAQETPFVVSISKNDFERGMKDSVK